MSSFQLELKTPKPPGACQTRNKGPAGHARNLTQKVTDTVAHPSKPRPPLVNAVNRPKTGNTSAAHSQAQVDWNNDPPVDEGQLQHPKKNYRQSSATPSAYPSSHNLSLIWLRRGASHVHPWCHPSSRCPRRGGVTSSVRFQNNRRTSEKNGQRKTGGKRMQGELPLQSASIRSTS
ncbi:hypothetical protein LX36DRAFT_32058 [Colletotrichum falcatum]|nr:hypothetical protein LX36DRAFT_32058 [Colletotrichum falcatum]